MHRYEIDQSGKVEQTNLDTILVLTNDRKFSLVLKKKDKRLLKQHFARIGKSKFFQYTVFSALLALLINEVKPKTKVIIDREYFGYEDIILERFSYFGRLLKRGHAIEFGHVGKTSGAHNLAAEIGSKKKSPSKIVKLTEIEALVFGVKMHKKRSGP